MWKSAVVATSSWLEHDPKAKKHLPADGRGCDLAMVVHPGDVEVGTDIAEVGAPIHVQIEHYETLGDSLLKLLAEEDRVPGCGSSRTGDELSIANDVSAFRHGPFRPGVAAIESVGWHSSALCATYAHWKAPMRLLVDINAWGRDGRHLGLGWPLGYVLSPSEHSSL